MFRSALISALAAGGLAFMAMPVSAQDQAAEEPDIQCPVPSITMGITTRLPQGWQGPSETGDLGDTLVRNRSGTLILTCRYGRAGELTQEMPQRFESCVPVESGFTCVRRTRENPFASRGPFILTPGNGFDLDRGERPERERDSDIAYVGYSGRSAVLESLNETRFARAPRDGNNPRQCQRADFDSRRITVGSDLDEDRPVCYRTDEGRIGVLTIEASEVFLVRLRHRTLR